jgi:hypothetical protein
MRQAVGAGGWGLYVENERMKSRVTETCRSTALYGQETMQEQALLHPIPSVTRLQTHPKNACFTARAPVKSPSPALRGWLPNRNTLPRHPA